MMNTNQHPPLNPELALDEAYQHQWRLGVLRTLSIGISLITLLIAEPGSIYLYFSRPQNHNWQMLFFVVSGGVFCALSMAAWYWTHKGQDQRSLLALVLAFWVGPTLLGSIGIEGLDHLFNYASLMLTFLFVALLSPPRTMQKRIIWMVCLYILFSAIGFYLAPYKVPSPELFVFMAISVPVVTGSSLIIMATQFFRMSLTSKILLSFMALLLFMYQAALIFVQLNPELKVHSNELLLIMDIVSGVLALAVLYIGQVITRPVTDLTQATLKVFQGDLNVRYQVNTMDETGVLGATFNKMIARLYETLEGLESRVAERTRNLELAAEVGRSVSQVRALDDLLTDAAELIRTRFGLDYVQVYLTNPSQTALILQSGTGTVGTELISRAHQLPLNTDSINGRAAVEKRSVVISDTATSATFHPNPLLPDTRSEMAVPLMIGKKVVGVLDLQSQEPGKLNEDILTAFEALAGQLAIAIQNATFLAETEQARAVIESQARRQSRSNWVDYLDAIHNPEETGFVFEQNKIAPMTQAEQSQLQINVNALTAPIAVTGESLGNLVVEMEGQSPISRTSELVNTVARQVGQQIESLRLLDSAERYRFEAEEASRRLTREGWKDYMEVNANEGMSYIYDLKEVRAHGHNGDQQAEESDVTLPLKVRDETVGKLSVLGLKSDDKESLDLVNAVAERLSTHIESLRQFEETKRGQVELDKRARQLAAVAEVSSVSSRELDIQKMLATVVYLTQRKFGLYHAHVFTYNENAAELKIAACGWKEGDEHEGTHGTTTIPLAQEQSLVARAARTRQNVIANDVRIEEGWLPNPQLPDTVSEMAVPLIIGDQILGVLDVQSDRINAFSEEDANIYATLASQVSTALQNAHSFAKSQQQADRESTLNIISQKIQSATTVEAVLQIAARELGHALGAPMTIAQLSMKDKK